jgi:imidazolonepropionase-like amidohydrolase
MASLAVVQPRAQARAIVIHADRLYTVTNGTLEHASVVLQGGKITAVGTNVAVPAGAEEHHAAVVMPGMIDAHTHMSLRRIRSGAAGPVTAEWKAVDNLVTDDPIIPIAMSGGLTTVITRPGSSIVSSGQAVAMKLRGPGKGPRIVKPYVDLKMAIRPLIDLRPGESPATVMGWYAIASDYFKRAQDYVAAQKAFAAGGRPEAPVRDERLEAFAAVLRGEVMVHVHSHYPSEITTVLDLAREFGFLHQLAFGHASESYPIAAEIARATDGKAVAVIGPVFIVKFHGDERPHNIIKELIDAGVPASVQTDKGDEQLRSFREYGSMLIRHGLSEQHALEALTINGARAMMLADTVGSIEVGKDGDLVLLDGPPFDLQSDRIEKVFVDGVQEYSRTASLQTAVPTVVGPFTRSRSVPGPDDRRYALTNATLFTVSHGVIRNGTLLVDDGRIAGVGPDVAVPAGMRRFDLGGRVIMPGWVTGRAFANEWVGDLKYQVQNDEVIEPVMPEIRARFAIDPWFPSFEVLREIGITSQNITPGNVNLAGGSGAFLKTRGMDRNVMLRKEPTCLVLSLSQGSLAYWGRNTQVPVTLASADAMLRGSLQAAQRYRDQGASRTYSQRMEAWLPALAGEIPVVVHADSVIEIETAMRLAADFKLRLIVSGGREAHKVAAALAAAHAGVILGDGASDLEAIRGASRGFSEESAAILQRAGVTVSFFGASGSRRGMTTGRLGGEPALNAAWVFRNGVPEEQALRMFTLNAAAMFGLSDRVGSLDAGKDADFVVLEGHPFDYRVLPVLVAIDGQVVYRAGEPMAAPGKAISR